MGGLKVDYVSELKDSETVSAPLHDLDGLKSNMQDLSLNTKYNSKTDYKAYKHYGSNFDLDKSLDKILEI